MDLQPYIDHFAGLSQGEVCMSIVFFISLLFSATHSWQPTDKFFRHCTRGTSPARALFFHNELRLSDTQMKKFANALMHGVAYGALNSADQSNKSKKNDSEDKPTSVKRSQEDVRWEEGQTTSLQNIKIYQVVNTMMISLSGFP